MKTKILAALSIIISATFPGAGVLAQGTETHGGDTFAAHFASVAKNASATLNFLCKGSDNTLKSCFGRASFQASSQLMSVVPRHSGDADLLGPDQKLREATNDGKLLVRLDVDGWQAMATQPNSAYRRLRLALHETSILAGLERGDQYGFSDQVLEDFLSMKVDVSAVVGKDVQTPVIRKAFLVLGGPVDQQGQRWWPLLVSPAVVALGLTIPALGGAVVFVGGAVGVPMSLFIYADGGFGNQKEFSLEKASKVKLKMVQRCRKQLHQQFKEGVFLMDGSVQFNGAIYSCGEAFTTRVGKNVHYNISIDQILPAL